MSAKRELRPVRLWQPKIVSEKRSDGSLLIWQEEALSAYPRCLSERILDWAERAPDQVWMAERGTGGTWKGITYGELRDLLFNVGEFLLDLDLSVERPLIILSENSLEHAIIALSAQHVGIPSAAIAPAYSLIDATCGKLRDIAGQITPGAIFAKDAERFAAAIKMVFDPSVPVISVRGIVDGYKHYFWQEVVRQLAGEAVEKAFEAVTPDTVAKFMFTSGTTGSPKAVIQTQRMLCANMEMVRDAMAFMQDNPPVVLDWAPWNHVAGGSKVFNMVLYNGGTFYIDGGRPTSSGFEQTLQNIQDVSPTWYFNVPLGFEMLCEAMEKDPKLAEHFFRDLKVLFYAGAGISAHTWSKLEELAIRTIGVRIPMTTGLGSTETAPFATFSSEDQEGPGNIGVPARGVTMKLVPVGGKLEVHFKGPNITPGYWRNPEMTAKAFDEEGFYNMGDALKPFDEADYSRGFLFDGRTAENFKLQTGTWVSVGALKAKLVDSFEGLARDAVITGENRAEIGALLIPFRPAVERLVEGGSALSDRELYSHPDVRAKLCDLLIRLAKTSTGSSNLIARAVILAEPLEMGKGEVTDKGSLNQRAVLANRSQLVEHLYKSHPEVMLVHQPATAGSLNISSGDR